MAIDESTADEQGLVARRSRTTEADMARQTKQAMVLREARDQLEVTSAELAELLGVEVGTLNSWLLPKYAKAHRPMNRTAKLLLERILTDARRRKGR